jgi:hypothetical protein
MNSVKHETSETYGNKQWEYLKHKINELETHSKNKNMNSLYELKKGYRLRTCLEKCENSYLLKDTQSILMKWKNYFRKLLNVYGVNVKTPKCIQLSHQ